MKYLSRLLSTAYARIDYILEPADRLAPTNLHILLHHAERFSGPIAFAFSSYFLVLFVAFKLLVCSANSSICLPKQYFENGAWVVEDRVACSAVVSASPPEYLNDSTSLCRQQLKLKSDQTAQNLGFLLFPDHVPVLLFKLGEVSVGDEYNYDYYVADLDCAISMGIRRFLRDFNQSLHAGKTGTAP